MIRYIGWIIAIPLFLIGGTVLTHPNSHSAYGNPLFDILIGVVISIIGGLIVLALIVVVCNMSGFIIQSEFRRKKKYNVK